jgi:membrane protein implicated in regulation of membrane protease activity
MNAAGSLLFLVDYGAVGTMGIVVLMVVIVAVGGLLWLLQGLDRRLDALPFSLLVLAITTLVVAGLREALKPAPSPPPSLPSHIYVQR